MYRIEIYKLITTPIPSEASMWKMLTSVTNYKADTHEELEDIAFNMTRDLSSDMRLVIYDADNRRVISYDGVLDPNRFHSPS
jgi:hypothetical protein